MERITRDNSAVCLIDHQVGLLSGVRDITVAELKHNVVGLTKAARALGMPTIATTTAKDVLWGLTFPELVAVLDTKKYPIIDRMTINAWDDPHFVKAVEITSRKHLIFAGVTLQVCAALPAYSALAARLLDLSLGSDPHFPEEFAHARVEGVVVHNCSAERVKARAAIFLISRVDRLIPDV